jgi:hypothetical protein
MEPGGQYPPLRDGRARLDFVANIPSLWSRMAVEVRALRMLKSVFGVIGALVPIIYCGYLLYYFVDLTGSPQEAEMNGLGPTLLGLGIVALLFCIVLIVKIVRMFAGPRSPGWGGRGGPDASTDDSAGGFDADAAVARYMARRSAEAAAGPGAAPPARERGGPAGRVNFGRKIR